MRGTDSENLVLCPRRLVPRNAKSGKIVGRDKVAKIRFCHPSYHVMDSQYFTGGRVRKDSQYLHANISSLGADRHRAVSKFERAFEVKRVLKNSPSIRSFVCLRKLTETVCSVQPVNEFIDTLVTPQLFHTNLKARQKADTRARNSKTRRVLQKVQTTKSTVRIQ